MKWNERLQNIIDYVEEQLQKSQEPIDINKISKLAGCSYTFFQKLFSYMNEISFSEYIRFRKMTLAGYDLKSTNIKVLELSYKYGYDSPTSFTKAFKEFHGISPTKAKKQDAKLNIFPKMKIEQLQKYTWKVEQKETMHFVGTNIVIPLKNDPQIQIPKFWDTCQKNGTIKNLLTQTQMNEIFGIITTIEDKMNYAIMIISEDNQKEYDTITIPSLTWVIFDCKGPCPKAIQDAWKYLNEEWIIKYPFNHAPYPEIEWYSSKNKGDENDISQIWIPIIEEE